MINFVFFYKIKVLLGFADWGRMTFFLEFLTYEMLKGWSSENGTSSSSDEVNPETFKFLKASYSKSSSYFMLISSISLINCLASIYYFVPGSLYTILLIISREGYLADIFSIVLKMLTYQLTYSLVEISLPSIFSSTILSINFIK